MAATKEQAVATYMSAVSIVEFFLLLLHCQ
jgi:hypothetical protein